MLVAGMLSTFPAIVINSLLFPLLLLIVGIESMEPGSIGGILILTVSAPVGEELCKAAFVLSLYKLIDSLNEGSKSVSLLDLVLHSSKICNTLWVHSVD